MGQSFSEALLLYLNHCETYGRFVAHPQYAFSEVIQGDWHLRDENGLVAIVTRRGNVGCLCTQRAISAA